MREISEARKSLAYRFNLEGNLDLRVASAQDFFVEMQWEKCHDLTSRSVTSTLFAHCVLRLCGSILQEIPNHRETLPLHLACLTQLPRLASSLFMLAHRLVRDDPLSAISWYAIGLWYFTGHRWVDARRYFALVHVT
jgi:anaphase-promoting complex subunit 6